MPWSWRFGETVAAALLVTTLWGCDDGPNEIPDCSGVERPCEHQGDRACGDSGAGVEECSPDDDGCLVWQEAMACGDHQECRGEGECACVDECEDLGARACDGDLVVSCERDANECLFLERRRDCTDDGQRCTETDDGAECVGCAADLCDVAGDQRCLVDVVQRCEQRADGCLDWIDDRDCAALDPPRVCRERDAQATCVEGCADECDEPGATRCAGTTIETCVAGEVGCLVWSPTTDCADEADYCDDSTGAAACGTCEGGCAILGASRCSGSVAEDCTADARGCPAWQARVDCATLEPASECVVAGGAAACVEPSGEGSCADPFVVETPHYVLAGLDFTADFTDDQLLGGEGCLARAGTMDAVFSVDLTAGQTLRVRETSDLDAVLSLQLACGDDEVCLFSDDANEATGHDYTATAAVTVWVIVETWDAIPRILEYEIRIDVIEPEVCDNAVDDDADGATDCDDSDCFGEAGCVASELNCADGADNDGDGAADCDDPDCDADRACGPYQGVYELFDDADLIDLQGHAATLAPDAASPNGYALSVTEIAGFPVAPGSGTTSTTVALADDDVELHDLTLLPSVVLYGQTYSGLYVSSNGYVTLGDWDIVAWPALSDFFAFPTVAGLWTDLAPDLASTSGDPVVTIDELADRVAVTFQNTPVWYFPGSGFLEGPNDFQMVLEGGGTIQLAWVAINAYDGLVGIGNGIGTGPLPAETDIVPPP